MTRLEVDLGVALELDAQIDVVEAVRAELAAALWIRLFARDRPAALALHKAECDGEPGPAPMPGMLPMPCPICRPKAWARWDADPYLRPSDVCERCGGSLREAKARALVAERGPSCGSCRSPVSSTGRALTMDACIERRLSISRRTTRR